MVLYLGAELGSLMVSLDFRTVNTGGCGFNPLNHLCLGSRIFGSVCGSDLKQWTRGLRVEIPEAAVCVIVVDDGRVWMNVGDLMFASYVNV